MRDGYALLTVLFLGFTACDPPCDPKDEIDNDGDHWNGRVDYYRPSTSKEDGSLEDNFDGDCLLERTEVGPDCDDTDPEVHPGMPELCDGKDNDCDMIVDEDCLVPADDGTEEPDTGDTGTTGS